MSDLADTIVNLPTNLQRVVTHPQIFNKIVGYNPMQRETGFAAAATGLPPKQEYAGGILNPPNLEYEKGYESGEPVAIAAGAAPFAIPIGRSAGKALAPKMYQMAEDYMVRTGALLPSTEWKSVPIGRSTAIEPGPSEFVPGVKSGEEMIVHHNLSPEKLYGAEKLGGMPVPSLAISKINEPLSSFGDITLIGGKEMAIPSKTNLAFKSDAYTARKPQIIYDMDYKSQNKLKDLFSDVVPEVPRGDHQLGNLMEDFSRARDSELFEAKFLKEKGLLPKQTDYPDKWQYSEAIRKTRQANQGLYDEWFDNFTSNLPNEGVNIKEKIFKGYTPSGNRRYADANLQNIVKEMKGGAGSEGFNYGVGNIRAIATPKFKNFEEILKNRDRLVSEADFKPIKEKATENYIDLVTRLRKLSNYSADDAILEAVENKNLSNLDRIYGEVPPSLKADIGMFIEGLKKMPTEYFEIKPQRGVGIGEFKGALIPKDLPPKARSIIEKSGIKDVYEYADEAERKSLIKKFGKEMFVVAPGMKIVYPEDEQKSR